MENIDTSKPAISLKNVSKTFILSEKKNGSIKGIIAQILGNGKNKKKLKAVNDISFSIQQGENFGIIGRNGSGKSTLVKIMSGAFIPDKGGEVLRNGTSMLLNLGVGMSHELTARQNIYVSGSALGLKIKEIDQVFDQIIQFAELEEFVDSKIKYFSSGMIQRLSFSIAVNAGADIMFLDEVFAVGDAKFRAKAIKVMEESWINGRTIIMVSHSLSNIKKYCKRALYLKNGKIAFLGDAKEAIELYNQDNQT
ncbi:ABC transporter ATP-binding protein [Fulvivirga lutea]|uniref:ABC transporter ATP-binding protein n=1 Tax=Fulvivirga lutea TaxID=2810512 RepID=A0A974WHT8_9BACT|nr:ATP-binding cassette domain-containing protein [Fulvivirga lutea]QSE98400.1 ABC transporter ATP-binding protein [Fulvivirga lutea]